MFTVVNKINKNDWLVRSIIENSYSNEQTPFNSAVDYLLKNSYFLLMADLASISNDILGWHKNLRVLVRRVKCKLRPEEKLVCQQLIIEAEKRIIEYNDLQEEDPSIPPSEQLFNALDSLESFLIEKMDDRGMLMPKGDDPSRALR